MADVGTSVTGNPPAARVPSTEFAPTSRAGQALLFPDPLPYAPMRDWQELLVRERLAARIPDTLLVLEHLPVVTLGRRGRREHLLTSPDQLAALGVALENAPRGGDVTYHGPGQVVAYPIVDLSGARGAAHGFLHALENAAIRTAIAFGVPAFRREVMSGAWCAQGKLAAIGFKLTRGVSSHGVSLNAGPDLSGFALIHGCGLTGEPVASLSTASGRNVDMVEVKRVLAREIGHELGIAWDMRTGDPAEVPPV
jgi:lipoyl(octanoyl) transferase